MNQILRFNFASNELHIDDVFSPVAFPWPIAQVVNCGAMLIVRRYMLQRKRVWRAT
jgi:hypothetical protein